MNKTIDDIIKKYSTDKTRLMDILIDTQDAFGFIHESAAEQISNVLDISRVDLEQTISFYHFLSTESRGKYTVYLNECVVAHMAGRKEVVKAFENEAGCKVGQVTPDGLIGLFNTSCIGMSDQEPSVIINGTVFTRLTRFRVKEIVSNIRAGINVEDMFQASYGDGNNSLEEIKAVVNNHIMKKGSVLSLDYTFGEAIKKIIKSTPEDVIEEVKLSNIRGRGGAGFPTGLKWDFCRQSRGDRKYVFCNADEGEPGTFKDRVIMTERPRLLFEGMVVAAYAIGSDQGILYLRYEYKYLKNFLESILEELRSKKFLGKNIGGKKGFDFDIRIQLGAGSYVCGEESALIESAEGKRGEPRDRPPFPIEKGYLGQPTIVNNVETLCSVVKVIVNGGDWYKSFGTSDSTGTKLLSVSGDCRYPGVYEVEWGFAIDDILEMVGAEQVQAVQVGGPSGTCIGPNEFDRILGYEDLVTGGSMLIINNKRDILKDIVLNFTEFFIEESCGSCTPCRTLPVLMKDKLLKIIEGRGVMQDLMDIERWSSIMKANRCGLGHTSLNPILSTLKNFRYLYLDKIQKEVEFDTGFRLEEATKIGRLVTNRN